VTAVAIILLLLSAMGLPLVAVAASLSAYPRRPMVLVILPLAVASLGLVARPDFAWVILALDAGLGLIVLADLWTLPKKKNFTAQRRAQRVASLQKRHPVTLLVSNHSARAFFVSIRDGVPQDLHPDPERFNLRLEGGTRTTLGYAFRAVRRGEFLLSPVHLRVRSRLRLWQRFIDCPAETVIHVYPDLKQLGQYALLARTNRLSLLGVRRMRRVGQDHDFERLRDYSIDDNYRQIEWRATARRQKLTVKTFQTSQSQRLLFLVDCGRMMINQAAGLSLLDHSLNAVLMLSYVALRQGDSVGMLTFSDEIHGFVPARGGMNQMNRLVHASFNRFPRLVESRYDEAFRYLAAHNRRRSLVVLISNVIDEVNANQIDRYLANLVGRHLPLGVLLRDRRLFEAVDAAERPEEDAVWRAAAAAEILAWRHQVLADMEAKGVLKLDVFPEEMTAPLVNRYLEVKARHLL
jgi:uncharacterized protein (DUF58 family)